MTKNMLLTIRLLTILMLLSACGDNMTAMDARGPQPPDASVPMVPDAHAPDAMPPPGADDPCKYLENPDQMANYPIRFHDGQGLEVSPDLRQDGLLELLNADLSNRDVIQKRAGAVQLGDTRSTIPGDVVPDDDRIAIWSRGNEVLLETRDAIYKEQRAVAAFQWLRAASWIRMRLREFYANTFTADVLNADYAVLGDATLVAYQLSGGTAQLAVYGPSMSREALQSFATSERPRLTREGDRVRLTYRGTGTNTLFSDIYNAGDAGFAPTDTTIPAPAGRQWDVHSAFVAATADHLTAFAVVEPTAADVSLQLWHQNAALATYTRNTAGAVINDVTVNVWPRRVAKMVGSSFRVAAAWPTDIAGTQRLVVRFLDFDVVTGALDFDIGVSSILDDAANPVRAVAVGWVDRENLWIAVEQDSGTTRKVTYYTLARGGGLGLGAIVHNNTALVSQGAIMQGTPVDTLVSAGAAPLVPGFVEQLLGAELLNRSGWIAFAPSTQEIIARTFVGFTGDATTRAARPPKGSLIAEGDTITWAGPAAVPSDPSTTLRAIAICKLDRTARANKPAQIDGTAVSPHAGYPRAYDGTRAFEHDWHTIPRITQIATVAGAGINAGLYQFAATWEADDANGLRYRSAPDFLNNFSVGGAIGSFNVTVEAMTHTERTGVRVVIWRTLANSAVFKRAAEAAVTGATQIVNVAITDTSLATRETLDQAPVPAGEGIVPSVPGRVTDFVALLIDRLASRDPRDGSLLTFTTPSREAAGYATHWYSEGVVQEPLERDVTAAVEMDGRIVMGSALGLAQLQGDGPDATGEGTFGIPLVLRSAVGIDDMAATERTPVGYAITFEGEPYMLAPNLVAERIARPVQRHYTIDGGNAVAVAWDATRDEITWLDSAQETMRLNPLNSRWARDSNRTGRDITVREDGAVYLLRHDGKVLRQDPDTFQDGAASYVMRWTSPWVREPARDKQAHGGFDFLGVEVYGEYLGPHDLTVTVYLDFRDTPIIFQGTIPAATLAANAAAGADYRYVLYTDARHCYACKVIVETSAVPNETARIAGVDVRYKGDGSDNPAQVGDSQRFPLEISFLS